MDVRTPMVGYALWPDWPIFDAPPPPDPVRAHGGRVSLVTLDVVCAGNHPQLSERVAESYRAWRDDVLAQTGYDVLGQVSDIFRPLGYSTRDYGHLSWHRAGRAVDLSFEWRAPGEEENRLLVVRDDLGPQTYWRLYLKARAQDGSMGEPLTVAPWVFWFDLDSAREPDAYVAGGRPGEIPAGYYVDLTRLAYRHGWHRIASYEEEDFDWRWDSVGREFWHYQRTDGLTWWQAMLEIYDLETMESTYGWSVCVDQLGMNPAWLGLKGIPTPVPESP
jgi:TolB protein